MKSKPLSAYYSINSEYQRAKRILTNPKNKGKIKYEINESKVNPITGQKKILSYQVTQKAYEQIEEILRGKC